MNPRAEEKKGAVLTLAMLGTGQHESKVQNILTEWVSSASESNANQNNSRAFTHLINGPGAPSKNPDNPMLGAYDFKCKLEDGKLVPEKKTRSFFTKKTHMGGQLLGSGYDDAIDEALQVVRALMVDPDNKPVTLNMAGFSRGADTILRISNAIYAEFGNDVSINIFAIDPVPGPFRQGSRKACLIPPNVKVYESVLMVDERRLEMRSQDNQHLVTQDPGVTKVIHHRCHGIHGTGTRFHGDPNNVSDKHKDTLDSPRMMWHLLEKFSVSHGSLSEGKGIDYVIKGSDKEKPFEKIKSEKLTPLQELECVARMKVNQQKYVKLGRSVAINPRSFTHKERSADFVLYGTNYFMDKQHMQTFKQEFPLLFGHLFQKKEARLPENENALNEELIKLNGSKDIKLSIALLLRSDTKKDFGKDNLGEPRGVPEITTALEEKWEGVKRLSHAVSIGADKSISKDEAKKLHTAVRRILLDESKTNEVKEGEINAVVSALAMKHQDKELFQYKCNKVMGSATDITALKDHVMHSIIKYEGRSEYGQVFKNTDLLKQKKQIARTLLSNVSGASTEKEIHAALNAALQASAISRKEHGKLEGEFDNRIRDCIRDISVNMKVSNSPAQRWVKAANKDVSSVKDNQLDEPVRRPVMGSSR